MVRALAYYGADEAPAPSLATPIFAGLCGAALAALVGRKHTRIDNFLIGGLFAGFAAYRDPRDTLPKTIVVACVEGMLWGASDRIAPHIKDALLPPSPGEARSEDEGSEGAPGYDDDPEVVY